MTRRQPSRETEPIREPSLDDAPEPTAADPWTVTLCWTPRQNYGQVSIWPGRGPVSAVWGLLTAGEDAATVAGEHHATPVEVQVLEQLRMESRDVLSEVTRERDQLHRALTTLVKAAEQPRDEWHRDELLTAWDGARAALSDLAGPAHPDTRYLTLCQREGRKSGQVTVGESRLPLHSVLATVQHCGIAEAGVMYPQVRDDEWVVVAQLVKDLDDRDDDLPTRAKLLVELPHDDHCQAYGVHAECCPGRECGCTTSETLDKLVELGWLRFSGEPGDGDD